MGTLDKNPILESIKALCETTVPKVSFSKMCVDLGLSKSLNTKLKNNPTKTINGETAQKIADYFGVSVDRVLGKTVENKIKPTPKDELTETQKKAWALIQKMDDDTLRRFIAAAEAMLG